VEPIRHHQPPARSLPRVRAYRLQRRKIFRFLRKSVPFLAPFATKNPLWITHEPSILPLTNPPRGCRISNSSAPPFGASGGWWCHGFRSP
jgi:hypothetical protein